MNLLQTVLGILFFLLLFGVFVVSFLMNRKTPKPPGCENLTPDCSACQDFSCPNHSKKEQE